MDGFIVVNKDKGLTSHDVVNKLRKILNTKKIGHTGTLDPDTTGVLAIAVGKATKLIPFLEEKTKEYIAEVTIGIATTTEDISGEVLASKECLVLDIAKVDEAISKLLSLESQIPPMYSAVKIDGKKLYEYARNGEEVERKARPIKVYEAKRISDIYYENGLAKFSLKITGSKGIYIRTLCVTLGEFLDYPACMSNLIRTRSGNFELVSASTLEEITNGKYELISLADALEMPKVIAMPWDMKLIKSGNKLLNRYNTAFPFALLNDNKELLAIYTNDEDPLKVKCVRGFLE